MADIALGRTAQVFIDVPNLQFKKGGYFKINTDALLEHIQKFTLGGAEVTHLGAYATKNETPPSVMRRFESAKFGNQACTLVKMRRHKDVDVTLLNDIWYQAVLAAKLGRKSTRHILVSGDGDYAKAYLGIRELLTQEIGIELIVVSWQIGLSSRLSDLTDRVHYLDDIPGLMDISV